MYKTYTWQIAVTGESRHPDAMSAARTMAMVCTGVQKLTSRLTDWNVDGRDGMITLTMRVSGNDQWAIQRATRQIVTKVLQASQINVGDAQLVKVDSPVNLSSLKQGEGRTPRPRPPRITPLPS